MIELISVIRFIYQNLLYAVHRATVGHPCSTRSFSTPLTDLIFQHWDSQGGSENDKFLISFRNFIHFNEQNV